MRYRLGIGSHSVYALYHYVQVVKYRRKVLDNEEIINFRKEQIQDISKTFEVEVIDIGVEIPEVLKKYVESHGKE